jgi:Tol biopolymer transport system component
MHLVENKDTLKYAINSEIKGLTDGLFPTIRRRENWRLAIAVGDFDARLNFCIRRIREALNDDPDHPRYIKTIRKDGYLFIAAVELPNGHNPFLPQSTPNGEPASSIYGANGVREIPAADELNGAPGVKGEAPAITASHQVNYRKSWLASPVAAAVLAAIFFWTPAPRPYLSNPVQLTHDGREKRGVVTDGERVYTTELVGGQWELVQIPISGGDPTVIPTPFPACVVEDISPDGARLLVGGYRGHVSNHELWIVPVAGGPSERVGNLLTYGAAWSPDGAKIAYGTREGLWISDPDGSKRRKVAGFPGCMPLSCLWSADGKRLRVILYYPDSNRTQLWEVTAHGQQARQLLPGLQPDWGDGGLKWAPDDTGFLFCSRNKLYFDDETPGVIGKWIVRLRSGTAAPIAVADSPSLPSGLCFVPKSNRLLVMKSRARYDHLVKFHASRGTLEPFPAGRSVDYPDFSHDGGWMAWVDSDDGSLWKSRINGTDRVQLTAGPLYAQLPRWSPHDERIAFTGRIPGQPWMVYVIPATGGTPRALTSKTINQGAPTWSPDGQSIMFGHVECEITNDCPVEVFNLKTQTLSELPASNGLRTARWSPDGRYAATMNLTRREVWIFDFHTRRWSIAAKNMAGDEIEWSRDSRYLYGFDADEEDPYVYRVRIKDLAYERVAGLKGLVMMGDLQWLGFAADNSLIISLSESAAEIYAYDWNVTGGR